MRNVKVDNDSHGPQDASGADAHLQSLPTPLTKQNDSLYPLQVLGGGGIPKVCIPKQVNSLAYSRSCSSCAVSTF